MSIASWTSPPASAAPSPSRASSGRSARPCAREELARSGRGCCRARAPGRGASPRTRPSRRRRRGRRRRPPSAGSCRAPRRSRGRRLERLAAGRVDPLAADEVPEGRRRDRHAAILPLGRGSGVPAGSVVGNVPGDARAAAVAQLALLRELAVASPRRAGGRAPCAGRRSPSRRGCRRSRRRAVVQLGLELGRDDAVDHASHRTSRRATRLRAARYRGRSGRRPPGARSTP